MRRLPIAKRNLIENPAKHAKMGLFESIYSTEQLPGKVWQVLQGAGMPVRATAWLALITGITDRAAIIRLAKENGVRLCPPFLPLLINFC